ncbi:extracellular solute-binding protein [Luteolibacter flavescens]|uniref:Extracellular solute-binding protein n=1 Tax=Luteolibacter flavescens TaxID=1859460 RepID=A0ABT3FQN5_9BACT|nr:extracellular solute-binding protein [Luteolibacter flavescens]MCW1885546.1 extracellular solute-binding protein [Luteolibacter flavescens]
MMRRFLPILLLLAAVIAAPILLRRDSDLAEIGQGDDRLVIITPHNESIRSEFGEAFAKHWKAKTGRTLNIEWQIPGGTSEIVRVIESRFTAAGEIGKAGVGIDIFFGGGEPEFNGQAAKGRFVPLAVFQEQPGWFADSVIPRTFTGENFYEADHLWVGTCLSQMGICYNRDSIKRLRQLPLRKWDDLADPALAGYVALGDPTKSGSVNRAYEMMIQEKMQQVIREKGDSPEAREEGWKQGLNLLQAMAANARYFTDSASKVPHDVAQGDAAAGTCIDFYGRSFEESLSRRGRQSRLVWTAPLGGTSVSVDPIAILKGAPNEAIAQEFVTYVLSKEGQLMWNVKAGQPGGPRETALRRLPLRRDVYTTENLARFSDPDALPYERSGGFQYQRELTGPAFRALQQVFRAMAIDPHDEMKDAWVAMRNNAGPRQRPLAETAAGQAFYDVSHLSYARLMDEIVPLVGKRDPLATSREMARISATFRANYQRAAALATKGGAP